MKWKTMTVLHTQWFSREKGTSSGFDLLVVPTFKIHFDITLQTLC